MPEQYGFKGKTIALLCRQGSRECGKKLECLGKFSPEARIDDVVGKPKYS